MVVSFDLFGGLIQRFAFVLLSSEISALKTLSYSCLGIGTAEVAGSKQVGNPERTIHGMRALKD